MFIIPNAYFGMIFFFRKLFVGGLSWETTDKELREHFIQYGEIESINVKTDPNTGRSRGFAFIVFTGAETIEKVLSAGDHIINNKKVDPKKAKARHGKIFVGGLVPELTDDDIKNFFAQYGTIVEVEMPFDKLKNMRKGFCFITFESEQVVMELLRSPKQSINGKEVKFAQKPLQSQTVWVVLEVEEVLPEEVEVPGEEEEGHEEAEGVVMRARVGVIRVDTEAMADMIRDTEVMVMATTMAVVMETMVVMAVDMITLDIQDTPTTTTVAMATAMMLATVGAEVVAVGKAVQVVVTVVSRGVGAAKHRDISRISPPTCCLS
uniref:RRM domain-containing protein n=1 Tax=Timema cristinae TaxID=61476 RepID=A0A7R9GSX1_TIMCR|nr:unnamed protein product [Timema cristinae]